jgi:hypothetical protein
MARRPEISFAPARRAVPGSTRIAFARNADLSDARDLGYGASIEYLEDKRMPGRRRSWKQTTRSIDETETLALATIARQMIESLWTARAGAARWRTGADEDIHADRSHASLIP